MDSKKKKLLIGLLFQLIAEQHRTWDVQHDAVSLYIDDGANGDAGGWCDCGADADEYLERASKRLYDRVEKILTVIDLIS